MNANVVTGQRFWRAKQGLDAWILGDVHRPSTWRALSQYRDGLWPHRNWSLLSSSVFNQSSHRGSYHGSTSHGNSFASSWCIVFITLAEHNYIHHWPRTGAKYIKITVMDQKEGKWAESRSRAETFSEHLKGNLSKLSPPPHVQSTSWGQLPPCVLHMIWLMY